MPLSHLIHSRPLLLLPPIPPSIRVFSSESTLHMRWPKYWSFSISPSNEHPGLISFRMDWLDLLAAQGTLKRLLQHHSSKASIFQRSAFFTVQLSHPYMTMGKTIALTRRTFVGKVKSLLFNMLSRLVITFLPRSRRLLISFQGAAAARRAERSCSTFKVRRGGREEIPLVQGKRNLSKTVGVARGHQRADRLKPQSQKTRQSDHRTTVLSNSMKLSHAVWGHPRPTGLTECGPLEKGMANHVSILALRTP